MKDTLINNFLRISKIPRGSGNEKNISDYFVLVAKNNNLYYYQDENYNLLIRKKGNIKGDSIAFQAHLDMVCVKSKDSIHNFLTDGIDVIINGDEVMAKDTTLGADDGIGLAIMLTLIEDNSILHPDLEFLFTVEEETTFKGAITFPYDKVLSKKMINLDYCDDKAIVIGSVGDEAYEFTYKGIISKKDLNSYKLTLDGVDGGNSGLKIKESESNAIISLINKIKDKDIYLKSINGGTFENDIATSCEVIVQTNLDLLKEFSNSNIKTEKIDNIDSFSKEDTNNIINEILNLKSGYLNSTSTANLGMVKTIDNKIIITYLYRSYNEDELNNYTNNIKKLNYKFSVNELYTDQIWKLNKDSFMYKKYKELYFNMFNEEVVDTLVQGGIEISSINNKINDLDIISIGANIENFHTIKEKTYISSWKKIYKIITNFISKI